jgi:membrane protein YqaA with SNARE-associated domain
MKEFGQWLAGMVTTLGPWGLLLVAFGDSAFIPMPQGVDALLIAHSIAFPETAWFAAGLAVIGSVTGSLILYSLARRGGRAMLARRVSENGMNRLEELTRKYGAAAVIPPMMIPLPLPTKVFVIAAGVFQMRLMPFILAATLGRSIRYFGEAALALKYGEGTTDLLKQNAWQAAGVGLLLIVVFFVVDRWSANRVRRGAI